MILLMCSLKLSQNPPVLFYIVLSYYKPYYLSIIFPVISNLLGNLNNLSLFPQYIEICIDKDNNKML